MKKILMILFFVFTAHVFSQRISHGLKVYEGTISKMEVFFPNLRRAEIKNTFQITDWVYISNDNLYSVVRFYFPEYRRFMYFLVENYTEPFSDVYKISNIYEYDRLISTMELYGFQTAD